MRFVTAHGASLRAIAFTSVLFVSLAMGASRAEAETYEPPPAAPAASTVTVRIESAKPATLYHRAKGDNSTFTKLCESPCEMPVPLGEDYQLAVQGSNTAYVAISGQPGEHVAIVVEPPTGSKPIGALLLAAGVVTFGVGAVIDLVGVSLMGSPKTTTATHSGCSDCAATGGVLLGVGLLVTAGGVVLGISGISRLSSAKEGGITQHVITGRRADDTLFYTNAEDEPRAPIWRSPDALTVPSVSTMPIFSTTF